MPIPEYNEQAARQAVQYMRNLNDTTGGIYPPGKYGIPGEGCIATATSAYGPQSYTTWNKDFQNNPQKYNFQEIPIDSLKAGDLFQEVNKDGNPFHMVMVDSVMPTGDLKFTYSPGKFHDLEDVENGRPNIRHLANYPIKDKETGKPLGKAYRFVGETPTEEDMKKIKEIKDYSDKQVKYYNLLNEKRFHLGTDKKTNREEATKVREALERNEYARPDWETEYYNLLNAYYEPSPSKAAAGLLVNQYKQGGKIPKFKELSNKDRYRIIRMGVQNGIHSVSDIERVFDSGGDIDNDPILKDRKPKAEFYKRVQDPKESITDWETGLPATHKMAYVTDDDGAIVYPEVQKINDKLVDFTRPPYKESAGFESAMQRGDTIRMTPKEAEYWTQHYKEFYPGFKKYDNGEHLFDGTSSLTQAIPKKLTDYDQGDWSALYEKQQAANNAKLAAAQAEWDKMHQEVLDNPDAYDPVDVYKYIGKRPETIQDVNKNKQFENDAKTATKIGIATVATPYALSAIGSGIGSLADAGYAALGKTAAGKAAINTMTKAVIPAINTKYGIEAVKDLATSKTIDNATQGKWGDMAASATGDALNALALLPGAAIAAPKVISLAERVPGIARNLKPEELRKHIFAQRSPFGYDNILKSAKDIKNSVLSGRPANIDDPMWENENLKEMFLNSGYNLHAFGDSKEELNKWAQHAIEARVDAWRMYNKLPQKYGTWTPNKRHPGTWTDEEGIKMLRNIPNMSEGEYYGDFINTTGGGIGRPKILKLGTDIGIPVNDFGVSEFTDIWDLNPFSRKSDQLIPRIKKHIPQLTRLKDNLFKIGNDIKYDGKAFDKEMKGLLAENPLIMPELYLQDFPAGRFRQAVGDAVIKSSEKLDKLTNPELKFLKKLNDRLTKFEVGQLTGAEPFTIKYDIPWTSTLRTEHLKRLDKDINMIDYIPGFHSKNLLPTDVMRWREGFYKPNFDYANNIKNIDLTNLIKQK